MVPSSDPTIITLTSIPPRFDLLGPTLKSLLEQDLPARIVLYVPQGYRRFPDWDGALPDLPKGVSLHRVATDFGPATKILPAVQEFSGQSVDLLFCDDDRIYPPGWHRGFKALRSAHPRACLVVQGIHLPGLGHKPRRPARMPRMRRWKADAAAPKAGANPVYSHSGHVDQLEGWAGAMVRPDFFSDRVFDIPRVVWAVDDTWLSGHLEHNDVPIWLDTSIPRPQHRPEAGGTAGLLASVIEGHGRIDAERACIDHFRRKHKIWRVRDLPEPAPPTPWQRLAQKLPTRLRNWIPRRVWVQ